MGGVEFGLNVGVGEEDKIEGARLRRFVGARFAGSNRNGWRRWTTWCRVTEAEPGRRFAFEVATPFKVPISRWEYDLRPDGAGCRVTETSWLRVPRWFVPIANWITGEPDRAGTNAANIATTLRRLKTHVEASVEAGARTSRT